jgi:serine/threonine protein kinase, bacterial
MNGTYMLNSWLRRGQFLFIAIFTLVFAGAPAVAGQVALFVSDTTNGIDLIHRYDAATGAAILPDIQLLGVTGLATGPGGDLFAVSTNLPQVYRYNSTTGALTGANPFVTYNGVIYANDVHGPEGMAIAPNGNLYIADVTDSNVHEFDTAGNSVTSLTSVELAQPTDVAFDSSGDLYVADSDFGTVLKSIGGTQPFTELFPSQTGGLIIPQSLTFGPDGKLYVLDASNSGGPAVRRYTAAGADDGTFISYATVDFQPNDIAFGPDGKLYVSGIDLDFNLRPGAPVFGGWHGRWDAGRLGPHLSHVSGVQQRAGTSLDHLAGDGGRRLAGCGTSPTQCVENY